MNAIVVPIRIRYRFIYIHLWIK